MKKNTTTAMKAQKTRAERVKIKQMAAKQNLTIGMDLGDRNSHYCILSEAGEVIRRDQVPTTPTGIRQRFGKMAPCLIVIEVGTHSIWVSRLLDA